MSSIWTKHEDPTTKRIYYHNKETNETKWEDNAAVTIHTDPTTSRRYSYNAITEETEWLIEEDMNELNDDEDEDTTNSNNNENENNTNDQWTVNTDQSTGRKYYFNATTGETKWANTEEEEKEEEEEEDIEVEQQQQQQQNSISKNITIHKDPKTNRRFSYNAITQETEWLSAEEEEEEQQQQQEQKAEQGEQE